MSGSSDSKRPSRIASERKRVRSASSYRPNAMSRSPKLERLCATSRCLAPSDFSRMASESPVVTLGLGKPAGPFADDRDVVQRPGHIDVVGPECLLPEVEGSSKEPLGLSILPQVEKEAAKIVECDRTVIGIGFGRRLNDGQVSPAKRLRPRCSCLALRRLRPACRGLS